MQAQQEVAIKSELVVQNVDHLGIVASMIDEIETLAYINEKLGPDPREKVSAGVIIKATLLNGLRFVSASICLSNFLQELP